AGFVFLSIFTSCSQPKIAIQSVPVSSTPLGADVYANGQLIGKTPTCVDLEKNRHHQVTISKPGFQPQNVTVMAIKEEKKLYTRALAEGVDSSIFFKDPSFALSSAHDSIETDEKTVECNNLEPNSINVQLEPEKK